jgi:glycosyltransferase involved in cell wall biosynthesis
MRVLLYEQWHWGHHYHCLLHILPRLIELVDEVVVAVTPVGRESPEFKAFLEPFADRIRIHASVPPANPRMALGDRLQIHNNLRETIDQVRPDYVLVPSGDGQTTLMGLHRIAGRGGLPRRTRGEVGIHYGMGPAKLTAKDYAKDYFREMTYRLSTWERIHFSNMTVYEMILARGGELARRAVLLPYPIPPNPRLGKAESRRKLGIPEDGRYIGLVAEIDRRKAIDRLLAAFRAGTTQADDRLLLAGRVSQEFAELIERDYSDMVKGGRIILMNRFIGLQEADLVHSALDIVCTPYPRFSPVSAALLNGIAAGCPVLANDFGWLQAIVRRFQLGWLCDVLDPKAFTHTIREAFNQCKDYRETEATRRLLALHSPQNYAESWLGRLREELNRPAQERFFTWQWVLEGLNEEFRNVV